MKNETSIVFFGLLYPVLPQLCPFVYLLGIYFALTCTAVIDSIRIMSWARKGVSTDAFSYQEYPVEMSLVYENSTSQPVPQKWIALNGVNLKMGFVGFLAKIGIPFVAFLDSLHKMGTNTVFWVMLLRASTMQ